MCRGFCFIKIGPSQAFIWLILELSGYTVDPGKFCIDMVDKEKRQFMSVVFCSPKSVSYVKEDLLVLSVPNDASSNFKISMFAVAAFATICVNMNF